MRQFVQNAMAVKRIEIAVVTFGSVNVVNVFVTPDAFYPSARKMESRERRSAARRDAPGCCATGGRPSSRLGVLMKLAAAQEPPRDVRRLQGGALGRRMGGEVAADRDQNAPALIGIAPLGELPNARLEHLIGVEARILA